MELGGRSKRVSAAAVSPGYGLVVDPACVLRPGPKGHAAGRPKKHDSKIFRTFFNDASTQAFKNKKVRPNSWGLRSDSQKLTHSIHEGMTMGRTPVREVVKIFTF